MKRINVLMVMTTLALTACAQRVGPQGPTGATGAEGPQGPPGVQGATGAEGPQGLTGATGLAGTQGVAGLNGANGQNGTNGTDGTCHVTQEVGGALITCSDNSSVLVLNGTNGTNGTVITPLQFCGPSFKQSYPNTFAESGFCIGGTIYGVYSANGGFLSALPPGEYSSDGINASCDFNIGANCAVTD